MKIQFQAEVFVACNGLDPAIRWEKLGHAAMLVRHASGEHIWRLTCTISFRVHAHRPSFCKTIPTGNQGKDIQLFFFHCKISIQQLQFGCFHGSPSQVSSNISGKATLSSSFFTMFTSLFHHCSPQTSKPCFHLSFSWRIHPFSIMFLHFPGEKNT